MDSHQKRFLKILNDVSYRQSGVLNDWAEMAAIALYNSLMPHDKQWDEREQRYLAVAKKYEKQQLQGFCEMLACVVQSLEEKPRDVLGEMYMTDEIAGGRSKWDSDVCFTPWEVSRMMAEMTMNNFTLPERGWFTLCEPAAGTGGLIIAGAEAIKNRGLNFQRVMHVTAVEVRLPLAHMCYIQLSLLHIPAVVIHGNTLSLDEWSRWRTPAHILGFWEGRVPGSLISHVAVATKEHQLKPSGKQRPQLAFNF